MIIQLNNLHRLDIESLTRSRLIVNKAVEFALITRRYGNNGTAIADRDHSLGIDNSGTFSIIQNLLQTFRYLTFVLSYRTTQRQKFGRCAITHLRLIVDNLIYTTYDIGKYADSFATLPKARILLIRSAHNIAHHIAYSSQSHTQYGNLLTIQKRALDTNFLQHILHIGILIVRSIWIEHQHHAHLVGRSLTTLYIGPRGGKTFRLDKPFCSLHTA